MTPVSEGLVLELRSLTPSVLYCTFFVSVVHAVVELFTNRLDTETDTINALVNKAQILFVFVPIFSVLLFGKVRYTAKYIF